MAWHFDEVNDRVTLADNAALTFPDGDWSFGGWIKFDEPDDSDSMYMFSWGGFAATNSFNWFMIESTGALKLTARDQDHVLLDFEESGTSGNNTDWQHIMLIRSGTTVTMYVNGSSVGSGNATNFDAIDRTSAFFIGGRSDLDSARFFGGLMAEWCKASVALDAGQRAHLVSDKWAPSLLASEDSISLDWYCPMIDDYTESIVPLTVTNNGSTIETHVPGIVYSLDPPEDPDDDRWSIIRSPIQSPIYRPVRRLFV